MRKDDELEPLEMSLTAAGMKFTLHLTLSSSNKNHLLPLNRYCDLKFWRPQKLNDHMLEQHSVVNTHKEEIIEEENIYE